MRPSIVTGIVLLIAIVFGFAWVKSLGPTEPPAPVIGGHQSIDGQITACVNCKVEQLEADVTRYRIVHAKGGTCPAGWTLLKALFTESDLNTKDGCSNPNPDKAAHDLDYLLAGESYPVTIVIRR